jgi:hypothetical protein
MTQFRKAVLTGCLPCRRSDPHPAALLVQETLWRDPRGGQLFVFLGRRGG